MRIKKGDTVLVLSGNDKDKKGEVLEVMPKDSKVVVKGVNVRKKHIKPRKQGEEGGIIPVECAINSSKVNVVCPKCGKATRIEYKVEDLGKLKTEENNGGLYIQFPGDTYHLRAVTVDKDGKLSEIVDLVDKAGEGKNGIQTKAAEVEAPKEADFSGNGALTLAVVSSGDDEEAGWGYFAKLKVTKGQNTSKVYMVKGSDQKPNGLEAYVKDQKFFKEYTSDAVPTGMVSLILDENTSEKEITEKFDVEYEAQWGGGARIFVTLDNDGKFSMADYYIYGYGTMNDNISSGN